MPADNKGLYKTPFTADSSLLHPPLACEWPGSAKHVCLCTHEHVHAYTQCVVAGNLLPSLRVTAVLVPLVCRYVLCPGCKSVDTLLDKDSATRLMHLRCQQCGASRTVSAIKSGFVARVTRRQQG